MASTTACVGCCLSRLEVTFHRPWTVTLHPLRKDARKVTQAKWLDSLKPKRNGGAKIKGKEIPNVKERVRSTLDKRRKDKNVDPVNLDTPPAWYQQLSEVQEKFISVSGPVSLGAAVVLLLRVAAFNPTCVPSSSMAPTLLPGDCVWVETPVYRFLRSPKQGEIVVFYPPSFPTLGTPALNSDPDDTQALPQYVKRVIAVAGNTIEVTGGVLYLNGQPQPGMQMEYDIPKVEVPPHKLFVLILSLTK